MTAHQPQGTNAADLRFLATQATGAHESFADSLDTLYEHDLINGNEHTDLSLMGDRMFRTVEAMKVRAEVAEERARAFIAATDANPAASPEDLRDALEMAADLLRKE